MKYANIDLDGYILGFYDPEINEVIPEPNQEIDDINWQEHLNGNRRKWNDITLVWESFDDSPYRTANLQEALDLKINEVEIYVNALVVNAYANPTQELIDINVDEYKIKLKSRRDNRADKTAGEIILTQDEKDEAKTDQKLAEYEGKCWAAKDKAIEEVNKGTDVSAIEAMDVSTLTTWPVWSPPV